MREGRGGARPARGPSDVELPGLDSWPGLAPQERERRARILRDIGLRLAEEGPRRAVPSPERGRLFVPFAALDGYGALLSEVEGEAAGETAGEGAGAWRACGGTFDRP